MADVPLLAVSTRSHISRSEDICEDLAGSATTDPDTSRDDLCYRVAASPLLDLIPGTHLDDVSGADF